MQVGYKVGELGILFCPLFPWCNVATHWADDFNLLGDNLEMWTTRLRSLSGPLRYRFGQYDRGVSDSPI